MEHLERLNINCCKSLEEMAIRKMEKELEEGTSSLFPTNINTISPCFHALSRVSRSKCINLTDMACLIFAPNLKCLSVMFCLRMEGIISEVATVVGVPQPSPFAKLEKLDLRELPELKSIYWDALPFPCLRQIKEFNCPKLKKLPLNFDSGKQISIEGYEEWWEELQWKYEATRNAFLPFFKHVDWWKEVDFKDEATLRPTFCNGKTTKETDWRMGKSISLMIATCMLKSTLKDRKDAGKSLQEHCSDANNLPRVPKNCLQCSIHMYFLLFQPPPITETLTGRRDEAWKKASG
ncbi:Disease resistance protein family, putative [Theobroma cacao]|uniref:Disease resistance protein family, putative n=1 Tax=Theobroma cacao TaxID=3641 RepID=S1SMR7_THECC|nr:Disease resistance protein family, putative [Theobroma cacao]